MSKQFNWKKDRCWFYRAMLKEKFYKYLKRKKMWELKTVQAYLFISCQCCMKNVHGEVFLVRIFLCWDWIWRVTPYLSVFIPNARKYGPEKLSIRTIITQCNVPIYFNASKCSIVNVSKYYHWWPLVTSSVILESLLLNLNRFHIPWSQINRRS